MTRSASDLGADPVTRAGAPARARRRREHPFLARIAVFAAVLVVWELVRLTGIVPAGLVPSPLDVLGALPGVLGGAALWQELGATLSGALEGFAASLVVGVPLGLLIGRSKLAERSTRLVFDFVRSFPTIALLPVLLLLFGATTLMKSIVVFLACVWPVLLQTMYGCMRLDPAVEDTVRAYLIPRRLVYWRVILPNAVPFIATGVRLAATTSVLVAIAVEVLASVDGLGRAITDAQTGDATPTAYVYIFLGGVLGYLINKGAHAAERRLLRWRPPASGE
ncbi:MAG TPA: ABC transporter permease [Pseudonocardiaceae bacterium]|nr:ABC transporter permease [Pseudonocardiaceae bacterium]